MVDPSFWKLTEEMFSKIIDKPKMSEKFLSKPPPRYVYDIIMNTMKTKGFPKGLYTEDEMNVKFFEADPMNKVKFFDKTIEITKNSKFRKL